MSEDALNHIQEFPFTISQVELPGKDEIFFVYLTEDRLYAGSDILFVYLMSDLTSPLAAYPLGVYC